MEETIHLFLNRRAETVRNEFHFIHFFLSQSETEQKALRPGGISAHHNFCLTKCNKSKFYKGIMIN